MVESEERKKSGELKEVREDKDTPRQARVYSYDEAVDVAAVTRRQSAQNASSIATLNSDAYSLTEIKASILITCGLYEKFGVGWYTRSLLATLSLGLLSMAVDMFGFSVVVTGCACDFDLDHPQRSVLISVPFIGPIVMSYLWGYLSDTWGRRRTLLLGLWGGCLASAAAAFSTHWLMLAALKIVSTSFEVMMNLVPSSSSVQSVTYSYLGEACPLRVRGFYTLVMTSVLMLFMLSYDVPGYFILKLDFHYNWGFISFTPWRLLTLVIAAPLGISALLLHHFCESPKFLLNAGMETEALEALTIIWKGNTNEGTYPVTKVLLNEGARVKGKDESLLDAMWEQIVPLFQPPLVWRTLQLFYLTTVIYAINNSLVMWMPSIVEAFTAGLGAGQHPGGLCDIIAHSQNKTGVGDTAGAFRVVPFQFDLVLRMASMRKPYESQEFEMSCISTIDKRTLFSGVIHGVMFSTITLGIANFAHRKKVLMMTFFLVPLLSTLGAIFNENDVASLVLFVGMMMTNMCMGVLFAYYVDLYPTSYRGMAACLGVMMSRLSGLAGVHFVGALVLTHCGATFYAFVLYLLSGIFVSYFLPPDRVKH